MSDNERESILNGFRDLEARRDKLIIRAIAARAAADAKLNVRANAVSLAAPADNGDIVVKIDIDWLSIINAWSYKSIGARVCEGCGHRVEHFSRWIGVPFFGHTQISCGCRLARYAAESQGKGQGMCGCEWTRDE